MFNRIEKIIPGVLVAFGIACIAQWIEGLLPIHLIGASVIALFMGMILNTFITTDKLTDGLRFTSKKLLKFAIILLGASLNIQILLQVGVLSLNVMIFTLLTCFGGGYFIGRALGLDWKLSNLISAGTGICGGSAIAAIAPVIEADDKDIAYAMSATFLFDMLMILLFPILGNWLGLSDMAYGLWAGTAINDTSSVVAAGYAYTEAAGDFATMVKLTRTLSIIPVVLIFAMINTRLKHQETLSCKEALSDVAAKGVPYEVYQLDAVSDDTSPLKKRGSFLGKVNLLKIFPSFILGFVALALLNSLGVIPAVLSQTAKEASRFIMVCALAAIGLNTHFGDMKKSGFAPMLHGFIISLLVVIVALVVEGFMGLL